MMARSRYIASVVFKKEMKKSIYSRTFVLIITNILYHAGKSATGKGAKRF